MKKELLEKLAALESSGDIEGAHWDADILLLDFIDDEDVRRAYMAIKKWYA